MSSFQVQTDRRISLWLPESFEYSPYMADLRTLTQNSWDAWTCSSINSGMMNTYPFAEWMVGALANPK